MAVSLEQTTEIMSGISFILTRHKCSNKVSVIVQNSYFKAVEIGNVELMFRIDVLRL